MRALPPTPERESPHNYSRDITNISDCLKHNSLKKTYISLDFSAKHTYYVRFGTGWLEWRAMIGRLPPRPEKRPPILFQIHQTGLLVTFNRIHQFSHNFKPVKSKNLSKKLLEIFDIQYKFRLRLSNLVSSAEKFPNLGSLLSFLPSMQLSDEKADNRVCSPG